MSNTFIQFGKKARGNVTRPLVLWAIIMAVVLFFWEANPSGKSTTDWIGVVSTLLLGIYLGWQRRTAAVFVAPALSWTFAWFPLLVASMIHHGVIKGFFAGIFLDTIGWLAIGFVEFSALAVISFVVRVLRGGPQRSEPEVVIIDPSGH